jgi:malonyl-CoA O-methyltransferase
MFDIEAVKDNFSRAAEAYDRHAYLQARAREHCLKLAKQYFSPQSHMLDAGCGTGVLAKEIKSQGLKWRITGLDLSLGMCGVARKHSRCIINADVAAMPFADACFDGIASSLMMQWANDTQVTLQEMARVIKGGGYAVLSTLVPGTLQELREAFAAIDDRNHVSEFIEAHQLLAQAQRADLKLVSARQAEIIEYYSDAVALMRGLQAIGATHKQAQRRKGLMTPKQFARMEEAYEKYRTSQGLPATWQVLYLVLQKE